MISQYDGLENIFSSTNWIGMAAISDNTGETLFCVARDALFQVNRPTKTAEVRLLTGQVICKGIIKAQPFE